MIALPSQYTPAILDGKHTIVHVEHSNSILKMSLMHFQFDALFQTSKGACSVNTYHELCLQSLNELNEKSNYCNSEIFNRFKQTAEDKTLIMPPSAQVCSQ